MSIDEILEGNKLIAEFMGATFYDVEKSYSVRGDDWEETKTYVTSLNAPHSFSTPLTVGLLSYDTSWDWLMPVVEKIEDSATTKMVRRRTADGVVHSCWIWGDEDDNPVAFGNARKKIESVWIAVVDFIKLKIEFAEATPLEKASFMRG